MGWASKFERDAELASELLHLKDELYLQAKSDPESSSLAHRIQIELRIRNYLRKVDLAAKQLDLTIIRGRKIRWDMVDQSEEVSLLREKMRELFSRIVEYERIVSQNSETISNLLRKLDEKERQIANKEQSIKQLRNNYCQLRALAQKSN